MLPGWGWLRGRCGVGSRGRRWCLLVLLLRLVRCWLSRMRLCRRWLVFLGGW